MANSKKTNTEQTKPRPIRPGNKIGNRFQPGESGNPNGRPKGSRNASTILREMMEKEAPDQIVDAKFVREFCKGVTKPTNGHAIVARMMQAAMIDGESWAVKEIFDRLEGKAKQSVEIDMAVSDWREFAEQAGISEADVISEARKLIGE